MHWAHAADCGRSWLGFGGDDANFKARAIIDPDERWGVVLLMNAQAVSLNGPRQEAFEEGVLSRVLGRAPNVTTSHNGQMLMGMSVIAFVSLLFVVNTMRSLVLLRRWRTNPSRRPRGWLRVGWYSFVPLVLGGLWLAFLKLVVQLGGGPLSSRPLLFMLENVPDFG